MLEPLKPGQLLHNTYEILRLLYQRQEVACYSAQDAQRLNYTIKEYQLPADNPQEARKISEYIKAQAEKLQGFNNNNLPKVQEVIEGEKQVYLVLESMEGRSLREFVEKNRMMLSGDLIRGWLGQVGMAIVNLHREKPPIVLGTLNPDNISVTNLGKAKIGDVGDEFFFPRVKEDQAYQALSRPFYAPEVLFGETPSIYSDIYSLGAVCYFCFHGQLPQPDLERLKNARYNPSLLDSTLAPPIDQDNISESVGATIRKAMQFRPRNRQPIAEDFLDQLLGTEGSYDLARIEIDPPVLAYADIQKGDIVAGSFKVKNTGRGLLNATVTPNKPWIKVSPNAFVSNDEKIQFWIDGSEIPTGDDLDAKIEVAGQDDHAEITIRLSTRPSLFNRIPNLLASLLLALYMFIPILLIGFFIFGLFNYGILEIEHFYQAQLRECAELDILGKLKFLSTVKVPSKYIFNARISQLFFLLFPFFVPYFLSMFYNRQSGQKAKYIWIFYVLAMFTPLILLKLAMQIFVPVRVFLTAPGMDCFNLTHSIYAYIIINLAAGIYLLIPPGYRLPGFVRKSSLLYGISVFLVAAAYLAVLVYYVIL